MKQKYILLFIIIFFQCNFSLANTLSKEDCLKNAGLLGYSTTIVNTCGYTINKKYKGKIEGRNKECGQKFGSKTVFNASLAAVHEVNGEMLKNGTGSVCASGYKNLNWYFE